MGEKYAVLEYVTVAPRDYRYFQVYYGRSFWGAVLAAIKAKRNGAGCVKFLWR